MSGPIRIQPDPEAIPTDLREREQWIVWRVEQRDGDPTKIPVDPSTGGPASSTDPDTWGSFEDALSSWRSDDLTTAGLGFVFASNGPFTGVDLDGCRDPKSGRFEDWAKEILADLDTYVEISPSGTGAHAILRGEMPEGGNRSGDVEMYDNKRFFTVTGAHLDFTPTTIENRQDALEAVHAEHIADSDGGESTAVDQNPGVTSVESGHGFQGSDVELIEKAKNAKNGEKFTRLWGGDTSGYPSHSEAQLALANKLAFWTGGDRGRMIRLFKQSEMVRDGDDIRKFKDYDSKTAVAHVSDYYDPPTNDRPTPPNASKSLNSQYKSLKEEYGASADRETAKIAWDILRDEIDVIAAHPSGRLYAYRGGVWEPDGKQLLRERAREVMGMDFSRNTLEELIEEVRATATVPIDDMGTPEKTVAVENGLLNLETGELRDLRPEDYALAQLPVAYDTDAESPRWQEFVRESVEADRVDAIQEFVGYTLLTGELPFARVLLLVGGGSNGKTTFLNVVTKLLGPENTTGFSLGELVHSEYYVAEMHGSIANIDADVTGGIGHGGMFKKLTGGDRKVSARRPYGEPFDYHPTTKQLYAANEVPDTKVDDDAFFRRWLIVEFPTTFTDPELSGPDKDPDLEDALLDELPGILNWALDGLNRLLDQGHFTNEGTTDDKRQRWRTWGDSVERFIEGCINTDGNEKHRTSDVYQRYKSWCDQHGETPESQATLTGQIKTLEGVRYSSTFRFDGKQQRGFKGFTFTAEAPPPTASDSDAESPGAHAPLTQDDVVRRVRATVEQLIDANDGDAVPIDTIIDELDGSLGGRDPEHFIENGKESGEFYEPVEGKIRCS